MKSLQQLKKEGRELKKTEWEQVLWCVTNNEYEGTYYGFKKWFDKRNINIKKYLKSKIDE